jgi:cell filamentation protein
MTDKISVRIFNDKEVRAVWGDAEDKWYFSVVDIIAVITKTDDANNYWKVYKGRLKKNNPQLVTKCNRLKLTSGDGKKYFTDTLDSDGIVELAKMLKATKFLDWFLYSENTLDGQSKKKAYTFWESNLIGDTEVGSVLALQKIHGYIFGGLYDFAGKIRLKTISKGGFQFAPAPYLPIALKNIELMPETDFNGIVDKYIEMNIAHPFMEGNGRSTRIWLDLIFKKRLKKCVDWSRINKNDYLEAMRESPTDSDKIRRLFGNAMTGKINDREIYMKGIDYSYYYEEN